MGLLAFEGEPLSWNDIKPYVEHVKKHGIIQFINNYKRLLQRPCDILKWGDEVEYMILKFDHKNRKVQLSLRGEEICNKLQEEENNGGENLTSLWRQEYASYMVEGTPGVPYLGNMAQFNVVEANMKMRRKEVQELLQPDEQIMSLTVFPRLGCFNFTHPSHLIEGPSSNPVSRSLFFPDAAISSHPRFPFLTRNIRERRGEKVAINVPIFKDTNTPSPFIENLDDPEAKEASKPDHIYMDCMGFGMGNSCLQLTFQACNIEEAKLLYDQLATVCPIMMALSAAAPIYKGFLSDIDVRWQVIAGSVDDRTREERGKDKKKQIRKSRYDSIDSYLEKSSEIYNDIDLELNHSAESMLLDAGVDDLLAKHIAHLWVRDPLTLFSKRINLNDEETAEHFEVEKNMKRAQKNNAVLNEKFFFRRSIFTSNTPACCTQMCAKSNEAKTMTNGPSSNSEHSSSDSCCPEMTINTIINGKDDVFPGFIPLIRRYLDSVEIGVQARCSIIEYLNLISKRASGEYMTFAQWVRDFVRSHPEYKQDSVVTDSIAYDLLVRCDKIEKGEVKCHQLFGITQHKSEYISPNLGSSSSNSLSQA